MADLVGSIVAEAKLKAEAASLFAYGGNGPLFGALVAERLGIPDVVVFGSSPVFSAFGPPYPTSSMFMNVGSARISWIPAARGGSPRALAHFTVSRSATCAAKVFRSTGRKSRSRRTYRTGKKSR